MENPFERARGLVGGDGPERVRVRPEPSLSHRAILNPYHEPADMSAGRAFFGAGVPVEVEIGFGRPHFLRERLAQAKDRRFLGFEVRRAWCEQVMGFVDREGLDNTRIILSDARPLLLPLLTPGNVQAFYVFFPDPWWKRAHEARRVVSPALLDVMAHLLAPAGAFEIRTDVEAYMERVRDMVSEHGGWKEQPPGEDDLGRTLPLSHREKKCAEAGTPVFRLRVGR